MAPDDTRVTIEPTVTYTVKEKLDSLDLKFDTLIARTLDKLEAQDGKIDGVIDRVTAIEHEKSNRKLFRENWMAIIALIASIAAAIGAVLAVVHIHG